MGSVTENRETVACVATLRFIIKFQFSLESWQQGRLLSPVDRVRCERRCSQWSKLRMTQNFIYVPENYYFCYPDVEIQGGRLF